MQWASFNQKFYSKYPQHKYADHVVYEIGSYYYSKGYYINSSLWFKKIPIHYHKSALMEKSIEMFIIWRDFHHKDDSNEIISRCWNGGPNGWKRKATLHYLKKVQKALKTSA